MGPTLAAALTFNTPSTCVRPLDPGDVNLYCRIYGDEDTMRHVGPPLSLARARRSFAGALRQTHAAAPVALFAAVTSTDGRDGIGICGLREIDLPRRCAEVGLLLLPTARACGLGKEVLCCLIERCLVPQLLDEIYLEYDSNNIPMAKLAMRAAFVPEEATEKPLHRCVRRRSVA